MGLLFLVHQLLARLAPRLLFPAGPRQSSKEKTRLAVARRLRGLVPLLLSHDDKILLQESTIAVTARMLRGLLHDRPTRPRARLFLAAFSSRMPSEHAEAAAGVENALIALESTAPKVSGECDWVPDGVLVDNLLAAWKTFRDQILATPPPPAPDAPGINSAGGQQFHQAYPSDGESSSSDSSDSDSSPSRPRPSSSSSPAAAARRRIRGLFNKWSIAHALTLGDELSLEEENARISQRVRQIFFSTLYRSLKDDPPGEAQRRMATLLLEVRDGIAGLTPRSSIAQTLRERVDSVIVGQLAAAGHLDRAELTRYFDVLATALRAVQSPARDAEFDRWFRVIRARARVEDGSEDFFELFVETLRGLWAGVEQVKLDSARAYLELARPAAVQKGPEFEREAVAALIQAGGMRLDRSRAWAATWDGPSGGSLESFVRILAASAPPPEGTLPETLVLDVFRISRWMNSIQEITLSTILAMVAAHACFASGCPVEPNHVELLLRSRIVEILRDPNIRLPLLEDKMCGLVEHVCRSAPRESKDPALAILRRSIKDSASTENRAYVVLHGRLMEYLAQPDPERIPTGLSGAAKEISDLHKKIFQFCNHHDNVFRSVLFPAPASNSGPTTSN